MHKIRKDRLRQSRVTAVFEDCALSFTLGKGTTLEELSDRLANLGLWHNGWPVAITVNSALRRATQALTGSVDRHSKKVSRDVKTACIST